VRGLAEQSNQDISSVTEALLLDSLAAARNRSFDRKLQRSIEAGLARDVISGAASLAEH
jgi:hypothetical protein